MLLRRGLNPELSILVLIGTLSIFLFAVPAGPYSAVHGPATGMRALQASIALFWSISVAVLAAFMASLFVIWICLFNPEESCVAQLSKPVLRC